MGRTTHVCDVSRRKLQDMQKPPNCSACKSTCSRRTTVHSQQTSFASASRPTANVACGLGGDCSRVSHKSGTAHAEMYSSSTHLRARAMSGHQQKTSSVEYPLLHASVICSIGPTLAVPASEQGLSSRDVVTSGKHIRGNDVYNEQRPLSEMHTNHAGVRLSLEARIRVLPHVFIPKSFAKCIAKAHAQRPCCSCRASF